MAEDNAAASGTGDSNATSEADKGKEKNAPDHARTKMSHFIFSRELAEVYLLLDHLSGRSDKSLLAAMGDGDSKKGEEWIANICKIGWPPDGSNTQQASDAATLLLAKDRLNAAAKPANGTSIAFSVLVAGDESATAQSSWSWSGSRPDDIRSNQPTKRQAIPTDNSLADAIAPRAGFGGEPPSRASLAMLAYPGLVGRARCFNVHIKIILALLFLWLIVTCLLSWNVAAGKAILARLNDIQTARAVNLKKIEDAEVAEVKQQAAVAASRPANPAPVGGQPAAQQVQPSPNSPKLVQRYCERPLLLPSKTAEGSSHRAKQFDDVTQRQVCDEKDEIDRRQMASNRDLASWVAGWDWINALCTGSCQTNSNAQGPIGARNQWAAILVEVLATAVLPVFYGFLGAGAAIVRRLWGNMKDSLLLPRDVTLAIGQLALGAVIGACIGLFISPSSTDPQNAVGLTTSVTLTPSALSFIAGFGVESVFVTLESLIKRIFNIPEEKGSTTQPQKAALS